MNWIELFGLLGTISITVAIFVLGELSRRLGRVTKASPYYVGFYIATAFVAVGVVARMATLFGQVAQITNLHDNIMWVLLYNGAPAFGITLALIVAWRYWSWLLAERG